MATDLTISITDAEEAYILDAVDFLELTMTPGELKTWLEKQAKKLLRSHIKEIINNKVSDDAISAMQTREENLSSSWPDPDAPVAQEP